LIKIIKKEQNLAQQKMAVIASNNEVMAFNKGKKIQKKFILQLVPEV